MTDFWVVLTGGLAIAIIAYVIGGVLHVGIDQVMGSRLVKRYYATTKREIVDPLAESLRTEIQGVRDQVGAVEKPDFAKEFDAFLQSDAGREWTGTIGTLAGHEISNVMTARITSAAGAAARTGQAELAGLIERAIAFENPVLDGLWKMVPRAEKMRLVNGIARIIRKSGYHLVPRIPSSPVAGDAEEGDWQEVTEPEPADLAVWDPPQWPS